MTWLALTSAFVFALTPMQPAPNPVTLTFEILNDDQSLTLSLDAGDFVFNPPTSFIMRDNVYLRGWYDDQTLTTFHDFDAPILESSTVYAIWDYLNPVIALANIVASEEGERFLSRSMTLSFPLYEPLSEQVRFQWQAAPFNSQDFQNIGGANQQTFSPFRNGTFHYRVRYRIPIFSPSGAILDYVSYYSSTMTLTIYGQEPIAVYLMSFGLVLVFGLVMFLRLKRKVYYEVDQGEPLTPGLFHIGEDISLQPKAKKKGYRFQGWYLDPNFLHPFEGFRMPIKAITLYAKFKKTKSHR